MAICGDVPAVEANVAITDLTEANASTDSISLKEKLTGCTSNNGTKNVEIIVPSKYLSTSWRILEMPLINCENTLDLRGLKTALWWLLLSQLKPQHFQ